MGDGAMFRKAIFAATAAITLGGLASPAFAQAVKRYPYDVRPPVSESGIDGFINRAADAGSTLLDKSLNSPPLYSVPYTYAPDRSQPLRRHGCREYSGRSCDGLE